jgi:hypothetical protein
MYISLCILIAFSESDVLCGSRISCANIPSRSNTTHRYITIKMQSVQLDEKTSRESP